MLTQNKLGHAKLNIKRAKAGTKINCQLKFTVGEQGINRSGAIKILFKAISDAGVPQFKHPDQSNYVKFISTNQSVRFIPENSTTGVIHKLHERPWWNGFILNLLGNDMKPRDTITIVFENWHVQTFCENQFVIKLFIDQFGLGRFHELENSPTIKITPSKPIKLVIIAPTTPITNKSFMVIAKLLDKWGNLCDHHNALIKCFLSTNQVKSQSIKIQNGIGQINFTLNRFDILAISALWNKKTWTSNPIIPRLSKHPAHFWADLHWQSEEINGISVLQESFKYAKEIGFLDITSHQGNDFQTSKTFWNALRAICRTQSVPGKHLAFLGYEWSGNTPVGGDHNVIFIGDQKIINRSSHGLLSDSKDMESDRPILSDLFSSLDNKRTLMIAHSGGRVANLDFQDHKTLKLIEIHSCWGTNENLVFNALEREMKIGVVANSDGHTNRPGGETPGNSRLFKSNGGLTCVIADQLTKKQIFSALKNRHCYATTGDRIFVDIKLVDQLGNCWLMGDVVMKGSQTLTLNLNIVGSDLIKKIELFDKSKVFKKWTNIKRRDFKAKLLLSPSLDNCAIFIKITQKNKELAWSSPIFITQERNINGSVTISERKTL